MSREYVSTEFDCRRISVIVHQSASDKLAFVHSCCLFGAESYAPINVNPVGGGGGGGECGQGEGI